MSSHGRAEAPWQEAWTGPGWVASDAGVLGQGATGSLAGVHRWPAIHMNLSVGDGGRGSREGGAHCLIVSNKCMDHKCDFEGYILVSVIKHYR